MIARYFLIVLSPLLLILLSACESDDDNKTAAAQECLDNLGSAGNAQTCIDKVSGVNTTHSFVIRCSASFYIGGVTTSDIIQAIQDSKNAAASEKEAILITALAQADTGRATTTYNYCKRTGVPGLVYISTLSRMGTIIVSAVGGGAGAAGVQNCIDVLDSCNDAEMGEMAVTLADIYCKGDATDNQICIDLESAIASAPAGDYETIARNLYTYLNN